MNIDKELIPVISVIIGGLIGFSGAYLQQWVSRKAERRKLIREKLEEIYLLSEQVQKWAYDNVGWMTRIQMGWSDEKSEKAERESPILRLVMLAKIYEPRIVNEATELERHAETLRQGALSFYLEIAKELQPLSNDKFAEKIASLDGINQSSQKLRTAIEKAAQRYI